jgi:hypothetical protein
MPPTRSSTEVASNPFAQKRETARSRVFSRSKVGCEERRRQ